MRINIQKLQFLREGFQETDVSQPPTIKYAVWKDAMNHFLKTGDRNAAISYLNSRFNRFADHRFDLIDRLHYLTELNCCIDDYEQLKLLPFLRKDNFEFEISNGVTIFGQIPRIDKSAGNDNYYITFYLQETTDWQNDIKYPLIQFWYAKYILETDTSNVYPGVYNIERNKHEFIRYENTEIAEAWRESREISQKLMKIEDKKGRLKFVPGNNKEIFAHVGN